MTKNLDWIKEQKKVELHRHLEGAIPVQKFWDLIQKKKIDVGYSQFDQVKSDLQIEGPMQSLKDVLKAFTVVQKYFVNFELVAELVKSAFEQAYSEGIRHLEFRFSPEYMASLHQLDWDKLMQTLVDVQSQFQNQHADFKSGYIAIVSRFYGLDSAQRTVDFAINWKDHLIGFDFADDEIQYPSKDFLPYAKQVHQIGLPLTVHTGEGTPPEYIREVLETFEPKRLGHATTLIQDEKLVEYCLQKNICIESCPTSNYITQVVPDLKNHPIKALFEKGVEVTLNTDDPTPFVCTLDSEWQVALDEIGLSKDDLLKMNQTALKHSFI